MGRMCAEISLPKAGALIVSAGPVHSGKSFAGAALFDETGEQLAVRPLDRRRTIWVSVQQGSLVPELCVVALHLRI